MKTLIIAGSSLEARNWIPQAIGRKYPSNASTSDYIIVHSHDQLRGMRDPDGIFIGTWRDRADILELLNMLLVIMTHDTTKYKIIQDLLWLTTYYRKH